MRAEVAYPNPSPRRTLRLLVLAALNWVVETALTMTRAALMARRPLRPNG